MMSLDVRTMRNYILLGMFLLVITSCQTVKGNLDEEEFIPTFHVYYNLDKTVYRPGEVVKAGVTLTNKSKENQVCRILDGDSVQFVFGREKDKERMSREPVRSKLELEGNSGLRYRLTELKPGESLKREMLITRFTYYNGPLISQVHYDPNPPHANSYMKVYSNSVSFEVSGELMFERDSAGLIKKNDAIKRARMEHGSGIKGAEAYFFENQLGFYQWWVNLELSGDEAAGRKVAYLVDPYTGQIRNEALPFNPELIKDPREDRPIGMPSRRRVLEAGP
jgi:hypothetical protein